MLDHTVTVRLIHNNHTVTDSLSLKSRQCFNSTILTLFLKGALSFFFSRHISRQTHLPHLLLQPSSVPTGMSVLPPSLLAVSQL